MEDRPTRDAMRPSDSVSSSSRLALAARDAMHASGPARTPTAWPVRRDGWWWRHRRSRAYVLFGLGSLVVMAEAVVILGALWSLGGGPESWERFLAWLAWPALRLLHAIAVVVLISYGLRFLAMFPKTQTPRILLPGLPERLRTRPPLRVMRAALYLFCLGVWVMVGSLLAGVLG